MRTLSGSLQFMRVFGALLCVLLSACSEAPQAVHNLPELPADIALGLVEAQTAPVLITGQLTGPATKPRDTPVQVAPLAPPKACTTSYDGYVTYPITVCYAPPFTDLVLTAKAVTVPGIPGATKIEDAKFFKLTSHPRIRIKDFLFCSVRSGPWFAHVEGKQLCNTNPNVRAFTAQILGAPEPVAVIWAGELSDAPPPLVLAAITESGQVCTCCSGFMCPDGTCKPNFNLCGVMPPAIK